MLVVAVLVAGMSSPVHADDVPRRDKMLHLLNQTRRNHGLPVFRLNANALALRLAALEADGGAEPLFHTVDLYGAVRTYSPSTWGENVGAAGILARVRTLWMDSGGHRANILNPRFRRVGIGVVKARGLHVGDRDLLRRLSSLRTRASGAAGGRP